MNAAEKVLAAQVQDALAGHRRKLRELSRIAASLPNASVLVKKLDEARSALAGAGAQLDSMRGVPIDEPPGAQP